MSMTSSVEGEQDPAQGGKRPRARRVRQQPGSSPIEVVSSGEWLPAEELHRKLCSAFRTGKRLSLDLEGIDHMDGGSLQLLLALSQESPGVQLLNASPGLCQWLQCAGATSLIAYQPGNPR